MKFIHTSDWHLGMVLRSGATYELDQKYAINQILNIAVENKVDGIFISGDVFDKSIASSEAMKLYDEIITYICDSLNIPVYMIAGNHDGAQRLSSCSRLLEKSGLYIAGALESEPHRVNVGDTDIYMLPWISTDKVKSVYPEEGKNIGSLEDAYRVVLDKWRQNFVKGHKNVLLSHAYITNADTSVSDKAAVVGAATMVNSSVFEGFDYVALGHLHGPQQISANIRYSGTFMAYSFGKEEKQTKSITLIDTEDMSQTIIPIKQLRKRTTLTGTRDEILKADYPTEIREGYIRAEITDSFVGYDDVALLKEKYHNILEFSGKSFEKEDSVISMTIDEFENSSSCPEDIFERYCMDIVGEKPNKHFMDIFTQALKEYEKEVTEG